MMDEQDAIAFLRGLRLEMEGQMHEAREAIWTQWSKTDRLLMEKIYQLQKHVDTMLLEQAENQKGRMD